MHTFLPLIVAAVEASEAAHGGGGEYGVQLNYIVMQVISFTILATVLYKFAVKPVLKTMDERTARIAEGLRFADEMKTRLADAEKQHAESLKRAAVEAQKIVDEAKAVAKDLLDRETRQATERTQQMLAKAEDAIALERRKMLADVREEIARLVALTASRVLSRELSGDERRHYTESAARELTNV